MTESFDQIKEQILQNLQTGLDFSPKGSVDVPVRDFVHFINILPHYITTSSCSGRISICYPGHEDESKGVIWTLVKHGFVSVEEVLRAATTVPSNHTNNLQHASTETNTELPIASPKGSQKYTTFKCEPFIMHICCRSVMAAKTLHQLAMECGFRESGVTIGNKKVMVAIRTTSYHMELPIATKAGEMLFPQSYLDIIVNEANDRLTQNFIRISKLLQQMKAFFQFPTLSLVTTTSIEGKYESNSLLQGREDFLWKRFGHSIASVSQQGNIQDFLILGGQGLDSHTNNKSSRHVKSFTWKEYQAYQKNPKAMLGKSLSEVQAGLHGVGLVVALPSAPTTTYLLISGGRQSPAKPQSCMTLYALVKTVDAKTKRTDERYLPVQEVVQSGEVTPAPRWGHCFVQVTEDTFFLAGGRDENQIFSDCYLVTISKHNDGLYVNWQVANFELPTNEVQQAKVFQRCFASFSILYSLEESQYNEKDGYVRLLLQGGLVDLLTNELSEDCFCVNFATKSISRPPLRHVGKAEDMVSLKRMGHHLTSLPGKTLLMTGGTSDAYDASNVHILATVRFDLTLDAQGKEVIEYTAMSSLPPLTCQQCRTHHQSVLFSPSASLSPQKMMVLMSGGGMMSLAFGDHLCTSLLMEVGYAKMDHLASDDGTFVSTSSGQKKKIASTNNSSNAVDGDVLMMWLLNSSKVKACKSYLEQHQWLNKDKKICKVTNMSELMSKILTVEIKALEEGDAVHIEERDLMAIPVESAFVNLLRGNREPAEEKTILNDLRKLTQLSQIKLVHAADVVAFDSRVPKQDPPSSSSSSSVAKPTPINHEIKQDKVAFPKKAACQTPQMKIHAYLKVVATSHKLPQTCLDNIPTKYELVGNILMIPDGSLEDNAWKDVIALNPADFWEGMIACYGKFGQNNQIGPIQRIARKAFVHSGPMRKSQIQMLYISQGFLDKMSLSSNEGKKKKKLCPCGEDHSPMPGWVTVIENQVKFSFDITRVMFCSGNNTERMRMGSLRIPQETVVDFYCGIGYYTVPILKYGKPKHHYALEWNPDSVYALRHNLAVAEVPLDRYTILFGDNQLTSVPLVDLADRILLGLLPSSVKGWPLAARALSPRGGIIHVHENVMESDFPTWVEDMRQTFERLVQERSKAMQITVQHVEIVKSYAPRVYHYVIDLKCVPII